MPTARPQHRTGQIILMLVSALVASSAPANPPVPPDAAKTCSACHGPAGINTSPHIPNLAGQKRDYLEAQLAAFHNGKRNHDVMTAIARQLTPAQRKELAAHFSSLPATSAAAAHPAQFGVPDFPKDYPAGFTVYLDTRENGLRKMYLANEAAMKSIGAGKPAAEGSAIVVENRRIGEGGAETVAGYAIMQTGAGWGAEVPELLRNDDWRYGLYTAARQLRQSLSTPAAGECLACHKPKAAQAYVFTHADLLRKAGAGR